MCPKTPSWQQHPPFAPPFSPPLPGSFPGLPSVLVPSAPPRTRAPKHTPGERPQVSVHGDTLHIGPVAVSFHRTLRIPDDGREYPLPASLGRFPIRRVADYADKVPASWREHGGVFLPMYQREAMWLSLHGQSWRPNAMKVAVGKVNALSGKPWTETLEDSKGRGKHEQDYMVVPDQPWLDGINAGDGFIKQFVAMPLGMGYTVEGQVTGVEEHGGLQLCVFEPKSGRFPDSPPLPSPSQRRGFSAHTLSATYASMNAAPMAMLAASPDSLSDASFAGQQMGLAAGGRMKQAIYPDSHGVGTWDQDNHARVFVHLVNSQMWTAITGEALPATPVTREAYADAGYPWFGLYDEHKGDIAASGALQKVKSVKEMDAEKGFAAQQDDTSADIAEDQVHKQHPPDSQPKPPGHVGDGNW